MGYMKLKQKIPPRKYEVGFGERFFINDCGSVDLDADEQLTFLTSKGGEYDVTRKSWGFYATPSINGRLKDFGLRTVLVKNKIERYFIMLVETGHEEDFEKYLIDEELVVIIWLDEKDQLEKVGLI